MKKIISLFTAAIVALTFGTVFAQEKSDPTSSDQGATKEQKTTKKKKKKSKKKSTEGGGTGGTASQGTGTVKKQ